MQTIHQTPHQSLLSDLSHSAVYVKHNFSGWRFSLAVPLPQYLNDVLVPVHFIGAHAQLATAVSRSQRCDCATYTDRVVSVHQRQHCQTTFHFVEHRSRLASKRHAYLTMHTHNKHLWEFCLSSAK